MRRSLAVALLALLVLTALPQAEAALNKAKPFTESFPYMASVTADGAMTIVSGSLEADIAPAPGAFGFFDARSTTVSGLDRVCWGATCRDAPARGLQITVSQGGAFALCFPTHPSATLQAGHVLGLFADMASDDDLNTFVVDKSLVAPAVDGTLAFGPLAAVPSSALDLVTARPCTTVGGLAVLDDTSQVTIRDGATTHATLVGKQARLLFAGQPSVPAVQAAFFITPFGAGAEARFDSATTSAAREGLNLSRVQDLIQALDQSHAGSTVDRTEAPATDSSQDLLADLLNGAVLGMPQGPGNGTEFPVADLHFIRFTRMTVTGSSSGLLWEGKAMFQVEDGKVVGARAIAGVGFLQMPWWSYVLWVSAIAVFIVRLSLKPDKTHPLWDRFKWMGWASAIVAGLLVFFLWDAEVGAVLGTSLLRSSGQARLIIGALQLALLGIISFIAAVPLRVVLRNGSLLAHQGTFMGLAGAVSTLIGFLLAATYLRAYLGLVVQQVMARLA